MKRLILCSLIISICLFSCTEEKATFKKRSTKTIFSNGASSTITTCNKDSTGTVIVANSGISGMKVIVDFYWDNTSDHEKAVHNSIAYMNNKYGNIKLTEILFGLGDNPYK